MLANTCLDLSRQAGAVIAVETVADEYDQPTSDITKDKCSKCLEWL